MFGSKRRKDKIKQQEYMNDRIRMIERYIEYAAPKYEAYLSVGDEITLNEFLDVREAIDKFYKDGSQQIELSKLNYDFVKVKMLESFEKEHPKEYQKIIDNMKSISLDPEGMVKLYNDKSDLGNVTVKKVKDFKSQLLNAIFDCKEEFGYNFYDNLYSSYLEYIRELENTKIRDIKELDPKQAFGILFKKTSERLSREEENEVEVNITR